MSGYRAKKLVFSAVVTALISMTVVTTTRAADASGCWSGYWVSCKSGHKGRLQATICKVDEERYRANFKGRFWKLFPFKYSVTLRVVETDGETMTLKGSSYLGRIMGTFSYKATVTENKFDATYSSCKDYGKWVMTRCCSTCE